MLRKNLTRFTQKEQGAALVTAIVLTTVLSLGAAALFSTGMHEAAKVEDHLSDVQAFFVAEMGVEYAKNLLRSWDNWYTWADAPPVSPQQTITLPNGDTATFDMAFNYDMSGSVLTVTGNYAGESRTLQLAVDSQYDPIFTRALCACGGDADHFNDDDHDGYDDDPGDHDHGSFTVTGDFTTDSYNSQDGSYASQTPGANGDVGSINDIALGGGTVNGNLDAEGSLTDYADDHDHDSGLGVVNGDATVGGTVADVTVTGITTEGHAFANPPCDCSTELAAVVDNARDNNNNDTIPAWALEDEDGMDEGLELELVGNEVLTLDSGVYYLEELEMIDNSQLIINGEVVIYLYDDAELELKGSSIINSDDNASNLRIYLYNSSGHEGEVEIKDNASLSAAIYAPNAKLEIEDNAQIYGAFAAGTIEISGSPDVHYDEDIRTKLGDVPTDEVQMIVQNWHEL